MSRATPLLRDLSLRHKLQWSVIGYALLALLLCAGSLTWFAYSNFHHSAQRDLQLLATVLAENSRAAVTFNDAEAATFILAAAQRNPHVRMALIRKADTLFAAVPANAVVDGSDEWRAHHDTPWLHDDHYHASVPIIVGDEVKGHLFLQADLREWEQIKLSLYQMFATLFGALLLLSLLISRWLNRHITRPLGALSAWAKQVSQERDFNARAVKHDDDEVGTLVDSLNAMLAELAKQESIRNWNAQLEAEIRERKEIERALIELRNRAEAANRAKGQFLANISHELRTPLNAIIGYSEMLQDALNDTTMDPSEIRDDIAKIRSAGRHLLGLINDILDLSKIEAGKMRVSMDTFRVDELIDDVLNTIAPLAQARGNRLRREIAADVDSIRSDLTRLRQILLNLLSNAVKFTEHGEVTLSCARRLDAHGELIEFRVRDTGIGIRAEHLALIFEPFAQGDASTTRKYGGTGLGLAISRAYARMLGGDIQVTSQPGQGASFTVLIRVVAEDAPEPAVDVIDPARLSTD